MVDLLSSRKLGRLRFVNRFPRSGHHFLAQTCSLVYPQVIITGNLNVPRNGVLFSTAPVGVSRSSMILFVGRDGKFKKR